MEVWWWWWCNSRIIFRCGSFRRKSYPIHNRSHEMTTKNVQNLAKEFHDCVEANYKICIDLKIKERAEKKTSRKTYYFHREVMVSLWTLSCWRSGQNNKTVLYWLRKFMYEYWCGDLRRKQHFHQKLLNLFFHVLNTMLNFSIFLNYVYCTNVFIVINDSFLRFLWFRSIFLGNSLRGYVWNERYDSV